MVIILMLIGTAAGLPELAQSLPGPGLEGRGQMGEGGVAQSAGDLRAGAVGIEKKFFHFICFLIENIFLDMLPGFLIEEFGQIRRGVAGVLRHIGEPEAAVQVLVDIIDGIIHDCAERLVFTFFYQFLVQEQL